MIFIEMALIPGVMVGLEFPSEPEGALLVLDLFFIRIIVWWVTEDEFPKDKAA